MEHKPIYLDGVDVSGCKYLNKVVNEEPYCNIDEEHLYTCSSDENCDYKQLARKTQECESLKEEIEVLKDNFDTATRDCNELIEELKQECENLKKELNGSEKWRIKAESLNEKLELNNGRYRKALEKIEEYIKKYECDNCEDYVFGCGDCGTPRDILDIINKAKDGN